MIELATCLSILKEEPIMAMDSSTTDLQVHVIRLLAQLAAHLVLTEAEEERAQLARKETCDALSAVTQQDPA